MSACHKVVRHVPIVPLGRFGTATGMAASRLQYSCVRWKERRNTSFLVTIIYIIAKLN
ncbi:MAG: hypothetical protein PHO01_10660 [Desulfotomaculaceae bacterium]|nr:hypothetical protein [Desulfotomaculaceae bacterium]